MFNTLASYLLGSTTISDTGNNRTDDNKNLNDSETQLNIIATTCSDEEVDDWLLVDREGKWLNGFACSFLIIKKKINRG